MKKALLIFVACGAGTFAALQIHDFIEKKRVQGAFMANSPSMELGRYASAEVGNLPDFRAAAKKIGVSVVSIDTAGTVQDWWGNSMTQAFGEGSGVIIDSQGYIVTNHHVVQSPQGGPAEVIQVHLMDGRVLPAKLLGSDARADIAVLKVTANNLVAAEIGNTKSVEVGQWVIAAGNPLGYSNTISVGVVSSKGRSVDLSGVSRNGNGPMYLTDAIQTDAAINPGNSGGALANGSGQLIGINSAIASTSGGSIGIGFSIPIDRVRRIAQDIIQFGRARYGSMGVDLVPRAGILQSAQNRQYIKREIGYEPPSEGILVRFVANQTPAAKAGIAPFSVLLSIDGTSMKEPMDLQRVLIDRRPGDRVRVKFWKNGSVYESTLTLEDLADR